jgi:hypothetical protein
VKRPTFYPTGHWPFGLGHDTLRHVLRKVDEPVKFLPNDASHGTTDYVFLCTGKGAIYDYRTTLDRVGCKRCIQIIRDQS